MFTKEKWEKLQEWQSKVAGLEGEMEGHMDDVIRAYIEVLGGKVDTWYYPDAGEGEMGTLRYTSDSIYIQTELDSSTSEPTDYGEDGTFDLRSEFPLEFLFISVEEVAKRVEKNMLRLIKNDKERKAKQKAQREARKEKKKALQASARKKLSAEEAKALGLK